MKTVLLLSLLLASPLPSSQTRCEVQTVGRSDPFASFVEDTVPSLGLCAKGPGWQETGRLHHTSSSQGNRRTYDRANQVWWMTLVKRPTCVDKVELFVNDVEVGGRTDPTEPLNYRAPVPTVKIMLRLFYVQLFENKCFEVSIEFAKPRNGLGTQAGPYNGGNNQYNNANPRPASRGRAIQFPQIPEPRQRPANEADQDQTFERYLVPPGRRQGAGRSIENFHPRSQEPRGSVEFGPPADESVEFGPPGGRHVPVPDTRGSVEFSPGQPSVEFGNPSGTRDRHPPRPAENGISESKPSPEDLGPAVPNVPNGESEGDLVKPRELAGRMGPTGEEEDAGKEDGGMSEIIVMSSLMVGALLAVLAVAVVVRRKKRQMREGSQRAGDSSEVWVGSSNKRRVANDGSFEYDHSIPVYANENEDDNYENV